MPFANCPVGVPQCGPGKHPEGHSMALGGRTRTSIASKDLFDGAEHTGSLFWLVHRTSDSTEANMSLEQTPFEMHCTIHLIKKHKHNWDWQSEDLPKIPILMNRKTIKQHQRLAMFLEPKKDGPEKVLGVLGTGEEGLRQRRQAGVVGHALTLRPSRTSHSLVLGPGGH